MRNLVYLVRKDLIVQKNVSWFMMIWAVFMTAGSMFGMFGGSDPLIFLSVLVSFSLLMRINIYDEQGNALSGICALPVSRAQIVLSKYLVLLVINLVTIFVGYLLELLLTQLAPLFHAAVTVTELTIFQALGIVMLITSLFASLVIPIQLKFGAQKSQYIVLGIVGLFSALAIAIASSALTLPTYLAADYSAFIAAAIVLALAILAISVTISTKIMNKKEL